MQDLVERDLVARAAGGDAAAFAALVESHYDAIYRMTWRWLGVREEAEDVAQDVCVKLASAIGSFRAEAEFSTWLYRLTYNATMDHLRARNRSQRNISPDIVVLFPDHSERSPETDVLDGELWDEVRRLPPQQRDAVLLVYGEDMSHADAAQVIGCSEKTVSWHLHAARKRLRDQLEATA